MPKPVRAGLNLVIHSLFGGEFFLVDFRVFLAFMDHVVKDVEAVVQALAGDGAGRLHVEDVRRSQFVKTQMFLDLFGVLGARQVLLVGQHQNRHLQTTSKSMG